MVEKEKGARNIVRRLDFGVVRKRTAPAKRPIPAPVGEPIEPAPKLTPTLVSKSTSKSTPNPVSKPVASRGFRMDFAPVHSMMPQMGTSKAKSTPKAKKPQITISTPKVTTSESTAIFAPKPATSIKATISRTTIEVPRSSAPRPVRSRGSMMDFVRRPASNRLMPSPKLSPAKKPQPVDDEPLMSDDDLKAALSGFASAKNEEVPRRPRVFKPTPQKTTRSSVPRSATPVNIQPKMRPAKARRAPVVLKPTPKPARTQDPLDDFSEDLFGGDGFGDDIDRIEAEIEAEANDFVKEPRPLFEDPLVQLSKAREEEHKNLTPAEKANLKNESYARANKPTKRAPYATLYDTKSPFITSTATVEKRPLSASAPTGDGPVRRSSTIVAHKNDTKSLRSPESKKSRISLKDSYRSHMKKQLAEDAKEIHRQTMVMSTPEVKSHNTALIIGIVLTVLLGAGVGALVYLVFFQ